mmetsp:Transcript_702/g.2322  ORF Transcript_702/g.2322 Transcript_702/m.2322 type:complete len:253 (-) Transcript_702:1253-2011(-)
MADGHPAHVEARITEADVLHEVETLVRPHGFGVGQADERGHPPAPRGDLCGPGEETHGNKSQRRDEDEHPEVIPLAVAGNPRRQEGRYHAEGRRDHEDGDARLAAARRLLELCLHDVPFLPEILGVCHAEDGAASIGVDRDHHDVGQSPEEAGKNREDGGGERKGHGPEDGCPMHADDTGRPCSSVQTALRHETQRDADDEAAKVWGIFPERSLVPLRRVQACASDKKAVEPTEKGVLSEQAQEGGTGEGAA